MTFVMHIGIDKAFHVSRSVYYFEYKGTRFKFFQQRQRQYSDVLVSIVDSHRSSEEEAVYRIASEWASALAWQKSRTPVRLRSLCSSPAPRASSLSAEPDVRCERSRSSPTMASMAASICPA